MESPSTLDDTLDTTDCTQDMDLDNSLATMDCTQDLDLKLETDSITDEKMIVNEDSEELYELNKGNTNLPLYHLTCNREEVMALLDTGASHTYVHPDLVVGLPLESVQHQTVEVANGKHMVIKNKARLTLELGTWKSKIDAYVLETKFDLILGMNWFKQERPVPDWNHDVWLLKDSTGAPVTMQPTQPRHIDSVQLDY
ncbi:hypothetical protein, partial, partial [Absidia glauca]